MPTAIVDHYERLFAFKAGDGQGSALLGLPIGCHEWIRLDGTTVLGDALIKTAKCNTTLIKGYSDGGASTLDDQCIREAKAVIESLVANWH